MVEKNCLSNDKSEEDDSSNNECDTNVEDSFHERNLYVASLPLVASFTLLGYFSHVLFIIFHCIWEHIIKLRSLVSVSCRTNVQSKISHEGNVINVPVEMSKSSAIENQLLKQKLHHKKAFEYISLALKIDEEDEGKVWIKNCTLLKLKSVDLISFNFR